MCLFVEREKNEGADAMDCEVFYISIEIFSFICSKSKLEILLPVMMKFSLSLSLCIYIYICVCVCVYEFVNVKLWDLNKNSMDGSGLTESLFSTHKDEYHEHKQGSLRQLYQAKVCSDVSWMLQF